MNYTEFRILHLKKRDPKLQQCHIATSCQLSFDVVGNVLNRLSKQGFLDDSGKITEAGISALRPYKVKNAVIMAAGTSSRFAPLSYEHPKGMQKVRGEVLVERQIRQLREAGIQDIIVVVGYKKEEFYYLEDAFGVTIIENDDYQHRNNNSTIKKVSDNLGNTYICSSDNYFTDNPFDEYVYDSYYSSVYHKGYIDEYCLEINDESGIISGAVFGGADAWITLGHAYWDDMFSQRFLEILDGVYDFPETAGKLWEAIYFEHIDELSMRIRKYPDGIIWEFDSLDELCEFDPQFIDGVSSVILDNICATLGCERSDMRNFKPIDKGLTNRSVRFDVGDAMYVYRHPGAGTEGTVNRRSEAFSQRVALDLGIDRTYVYEDPSIGWKISHFIDNCIPFDYHNEKHVGAAMETIRKLHGCDASSEWSFDVYQAAIGIVELLGTSPSINPNNVSGLASRLHGCVLSDESSPVLCHNDFYGDNLLVHASGIELIDWEYSAMSDYASDIGTFVCCSDYGLDEAHWVLSEYFGREPSKVEERHCMAYVALCSYYWFVWALYKEKLEEPMGGWPSLWQRNAILFGEHALELYEKPL